MAGNPHDPHLEALRAGLQVAAQIALDTPDPAPPDERDIQRATKQLAHHIDLCLIGGPGVRTAFTTLARDLALLARTEHGVDLLGLHLCAQPHPGCPHQ